jgi:hypothetical protein
MLCLRIETLLVLEPALAAALCPSNAYTPGTGAAGADHQQLMFHITTYING